MIIYFFFVPRLCSSFRLFPLIRFVFPIYIYMCVDCYYPLPVSLILKARDPRVIMTTRNARRRARVSVVAARCVFLTDDFPHFPPSRLPVPSYPTRCLHRRVSAEKYERDEKYLVDKFGWIAVAFSTFGDHFEWGKTNKQKKQQRSKSKCQSIGFAGSDQDDPSGMKALGFSPCCFSRENRSAEKSKEAIKKVTNDEVEKETQPSMHTQHLLLVIIYGLTRFGWLTRTSPLQR